MSGVQISHGLCGCGRPAEYTIGIDQHGQYIHACNKHGRCLSYDQQIERIVELKNKLSKADALVRKANKIFNFNSAAHRKEWNTDFQKYRENT
jgi:hypothetical protein